MFLLFYALRMSYSIQLGKNITVQGQTWTMASVLNLQIFGLSHSLQCLNKTPSIMNAEYSRFLSIMHLFETVMPHSVTMELFCIAEEIEAQIHQTTEVFVPYALFNESLQLHLYRSNNYICLQIYFSLKT